MAPPASDLARGDDVQIQEASESLFQFWKVGEGLFLPTSNPEFQLPPPLNFLLDLVDTLPVTLANKTYRTIMNHALRTLRELNEDKIIRSLSVTEAHCLHLVLAMLSLAYIHGSAGEPDGIALPEPLAKFLFTVSRRIGRGPMLDYAAIVLSNWRLTEAGEALMKKEGLSAAEVIARDMDYFRARFLFTGSEDEEHFYRCHVFIEAKMAQLYSLFATISKAIGRTETTGEAAQKELEASLAIVVQTLEHVARVLEEQPAVWRKLEANCNPFVFFYRMRRYLCSLENVVFTGQGTFSFCGPTGAQSSLLQMIDTALGINAPSGALGDTLSKIRGSKPAAHVHYLQQLSEQCHGGVQGYLKRLRETAVDSKNEEVVKKAVNLYNKCIHFVCKIREQHLGFVRRYILEQVKAGAHVSGSGGTALLPSSSTSSPSSPSPSSPASTSFPERAEEEDKEIHEEKEKGDSRGGDSPVEMLGQQVSTTLEALVTLTVSPAEGSPGLIQCVVRNADAAVIAEMDVDAESEVATRVETKAGEEEGVVTPWVATGVINCHKLVTDFGCSYITAKDKDRFRQLTGHKLHPFLTREFFFSHRDLDLLLDKYERGEKFYLYTGRGPSSDAMHVGHLLPFQFTVWLQKVFNAPVVIQMTDDEKFLFRNGLSYEMLQHMLRENAKDIIACGFDPDNTFIFGDFEYMGKMYREVVKIENLVTANQAFGIFGFNMSDSIGKIRFAATQAAPSFSNAFPHIFKKDSNVYCLIPQAIDQDPYFRMTRDVAGRLNYTKPALIHCKFFPGLHGAQSKMSASNTSNSVFLTDTKEMIKAKVQRAHSGGGKTLELHRANGANLAEDVPYQWLCAFLEDDERLAEIGRRYESGEMLTGEIKKILVEEVWRVVDAHQQARAKVTDEVLDLFMRERPLRGGNL